jgi:methionyl-tRNA formyltransferase
MNVYALTSLEIGRNTVKSILRHFPIKGLIGLSDRKKSDSISGFSYQKPFCDESNIDFIEVDSYALKNSKDQKKLLSLEIDVLIVCGWQRLIPNWLIEHCTIAAVGMHGSPFGITKGRGRSPHNWSLILGEKSFEISIFKIDDGVDSGNVLDHRTFFYSPYDDINTYHYKTSLLVSEMVVNFLKNPRKAVKNSAPQKLQEAEYFPKRAPEDGYIDWNRSPKELRCFISALTKPYPGARTILKNGEEITIWSVSPFEVNITNTFQPGEIVTIFSQKDLLVKVKDGFVLVTDHSCNLNSAPPDVKEGDIFQSVNFKEQMRSLCKRHEDKFSNLKISSEIKKLCS